MRHLIIINIKYDLLKGQTMLTYKVLKYSSPCIPGNPLLLPILLRKNFVNNYYSMIKSSQMISELMHEHVKSLH